MASMVMLVDINGTVINYRFLFYQPWVHEEVLRKYYPGLFVLTRQWRGWLSVYLFVVRYFVIGGGKVILPICLQKDVNFYFSNAFPLCVLMTDPCYADLVFEHYLEPFGMSLEKGHLEMGFLDGYQYGDIDCLDTRIFRCVELQSCFIDYSNPISQIDYMLTQGYYAVAFVDEYYLINKQKKREHFTHEYLIYGTDSDAVYAIGFDERSIFSKLVFEKTHFCNAIIHAEKYIDQRPLCKWVRDKQLIFIKTAPRECKYPLRPQVIKKKLDAYLSGVADEENILLRLTGEELKQKIVEQPIVTQFYGRNTKLAVIDHLYKQIENTSRNIHPSINFQCVHMYKEQCNLALQRARVISDIYDLSACIRELEADLKKAEVVRMLCLKAGLSHINTYDAIPLIHRMIDIIGE